MKHVPVSYIANLTVNTNALTVARAVASPTSGLKVCNRTWLKITIPRAFIGQWLICLQLDVNSLPVFVTDSRHCVMKLTEMEMIRSAVSGRSISTMVNVLNNNNNNNNMNECLK